MTKCHMRGGPCAITPRPYAQFGRSRCIMRRQWLSGSPPGRSVQWFMVLGTGWKGTCKRKDTFASTQMPSSVQHRTAARFSRGLMRMVHRHMAHATPLPGAIPPTCNSNQWQGNLGTPSPSPSTAAYSSEPHPPGQPLGRQLRAHQERHSTLAGATKAALLLTHSPTCTLAPQCPRSLNHSPHLSKQSVRVHRKVPLATHPSIHSHPPGNTRQRDVSGIWWLLPWQPPEAGRPRPPHDFLAQNASILTTLTLQEPLLAQEDSPPPPACSEIDPGAGCTCDETTRQL